VNFVDFSQQQNYVTSRLKEYGVVLSEKNAMRQIELGNKIHFMSNSICLIAFFSLNTTPYSFSLEVT
jgi:hypothetical protein